MHSRIDPFSLYRAIPWKTLRVEESYVLDLKVKREHFPRYETRLLGGMLVIFVLSILFMIGVSRSLWVMAGVSCLSILFTIFRNRLYIEQIDDHVLYSGQWILDARFILACFGILPMTLTIILVFLKSDFSNSSEQILGAAVAGALIYLGWRILNYFSIKRPATRKILTRTKKALLTTNPDKTSDEDVAQTLNRLLEAKKAASVESDALELAKSIGLPEDAVRNALDQKGPLPPARHHAAITVFAVLDQVFMVLGVIFQVLEIIRTAIKSWY